MGNLKVSPNFHNRTGQLRFPSKNLNAFAAKEIVSDWNFWQSNYNCYSWLPLNNLQKYILHVLSSSPFKWQKHYNCAWTPTGANRVDRKEMVPTPVKMNEEFCYDELMDSCFEHFLNWSGTGPLNLDTNGVAIVNEVSRLTALEATEGGRQILALGSLYDPDVVEFNEDVAPEVIEDYKRTWNAVSGWMLLLKQMGQSASTQHLDQPGIFTTDMFSTDGETFIGDVMSLFDSLKASAKPDLRKLINKGSVVQSRTGGVFRPLFKVSGSIFNAIVEEYNRQCISNNCTNPRLTARDFGIGGNTDARFATNSQRVYFIDGMPVIPMDDVNCFDEYLTGTTHFAAIAGSGVICLGGSFGNIPSIDNNITGLIIQQETNVKELGKWYWLAHALMATNISDYRYIVAAQQYAVGG